jgi:hypothetical protein
LHAWIDGKCIQTFSRKGRCADGRMILKQSGLHSSGSGLDPLPGFCEYGSEPSDFVEAGEFLDHLSDCQILIFRLLS